jgi:predicted amidohydrolase YtcJ
MIPRFTGGRVLAAAGRRALTPAGGQAPIATRRWVLAAVSLSCIGLSACDDGPGAGSESAPVDLLLTNGRVYTLTWPAPATDGTPSSEAPYGADGWRPDAEAVAIRDGALVFVGSDAEAEAYRANAARVVDVGGATVLPGLVDAHVHIASLGARLEQVDLVGAETEEEAIARVVERTARYAPGEWILGWGWDEGAWADRYPTHERLTAAIPDHPVLLRGLHGFALWANRPALERAGIDAGTPAPAGGEIRRDPEGRPTGLFLNRATTLFDAVLPEATPERLERQVVSGLRAMAEDGFVMVHEAGADAALMTALETLERDGGLPVRVYAMLSGRDTALLEAWRERGPDAPGGEGPAERLITRSVKGHYDGALGSRGALMLDDYSDLPGQTGIGSHGYGYDHDRIAELARVGFQPAIHAIGDAGNRETLDFMAALFEDTAALHALRPRIEHAQIVHPDDFRRFADLGVIASMQPPHMAEDKTWAEQRLGPERIRGAYAWRTFRETGVPLAFSSDLPGSDHDIFYGLHAAVTRRDTALEPSGGWYPEQRLTPEEAVRGYTSGAAYAAHLETRTGVLAPGRWADITVLSVDPLATPPDSYERILRGSIVLTIVGGEIVYERLSGAHLAE